MENNIFKYGEFEGRFDPTDYVQLEAYELGLKAVSEASKTVKQETSPAEKMRLIALTITDEFLDVVFGDGAANLMLGDRITSLAQLYDVMGALIKFVKETDVETAGKIKATVSALGGNRAGRRAK